MDLYQPFRDIDSHELFRDGIGVINWRREAAFASDRDSDFNAVMPQ
jgi:hypothetical protein